MQKFADYIQKSIWGPEYYRELLRKPASYSWKYYWGFTMLLALFMTVVSTIPLIPLVSNSLNSIENGILSYYPDNLEVRIDKGEVSTNVPEPYFFPIPEVIRKYMPTSTDYLGVIDTKASPSVEQFKAYRSAFWLSKEYLVSGDRSGGIRRSKFAREISYHIDKSGLRTVISTIQPFFNLIPPILVIAIFVGMLISFALNLIYLLFGALLVFFMGKLIGQKWSYGTSYRLCLHATTLPLFVGLVFTILPTVLNIPFLSTGLLLIVVYMNFYYTPAPRPAPVAPKDQAPNIKDDSPGSGWPSD